MTLVADEPGDLVGRLFREIVQMRQSLEERIDSVEIKVGSLRSEMLGHFDEIYRRLDRLETEYQAIRAGVTRLEQALAEDTVRREALRRQIGELKERVADLEERLARLEEGTDSSHDA